MIHYFNRKPYHKQMTVSWNYSYHRDSWVRAKWDNDVKPIKLKLIHLTQLAHPQKASGPQTDVLKAKSIFLCDELTALVPWIKNVPTTLLRIGHFWNLCWRTHLRSCLSANQQNIYCNSSAILRQCILAQDYVINRFPGTKPYRNNEPNVALPAKCCWSARKMTITLDSLLIRAFFNLHCRLNKTRATFVLHNVKHSKLANVGRTQELLSSVHFQGNSIVSCLDVIFYIVLGVFYCVCPCRSVVFQMLAVQTCFIAEFGGG